MIGRLTTFAALALASTVDAGDPGPRVTVREWEVARPPIVIERPPRRFQEVTTVETFEITPRQTIDVEVLEARPRYRLEAVEARPRFEVPAYAAPAPRYQVPAAGRVPVVPAIGTAARVPVGSVRSGLFDQKQNVFFSDGSAIQYGPFGHPRRRY